MILYKKTFLFKYQDKGFKENKSTADDIWKNPQMFLEVRKTFML